MERGRQVGFHERQAGRERVWVGVEVLSEGPGVARGEDGRVWVQGKGTAKLGPRWAQR